MGLFGKLFSKRVNPDAERALRLFEQALDDSKKPQGLYKMARLGAETRQQLLKLIEEVEAEIGQTALAFAQDVGAMGVHPKLIELLRDEPGDSLLHESTLYVAFPTPYGRRRFNEQWPSAVGKYHGRHNSKELLREKGHILASLIANNLDIAISIFPQTGENVRELTDEQETAVRLEEAALWNRIIFQLAHGYLGSDFTLFMDFFEDSLANVLALQGAPPDSIFSAMKDRTIEYARYCKWIPSDDEGTGGTLLWEAAKHIGETLDCSTNPFFLIKFGVIFIERLNRALVYEFLTGKQDSNK